MQTILGSNGVVCHELAKNLPQYTDKIRLVSRNPKPVNPGDELFSADLLDAQQTGKAVAGSQVVYLTVGLVYNTKVWQAQWPLVMRNVLAACQQHGARLVFFDNVYAYGRVQGWMREDTPLKPVSRKGAVRMELARMIMEKVEQGQVQAIIARAADFYGPNKTLSVVNSLVFDNLSRGKPAQWMINDRVKHTFTYTPDAGQATALLGNTDTAFNQVWHIPTDGNAVTGKQFIELCAQAFGVTPKVSLLPKTMIQFAGLFSGLIRENIEMLYQSDSDYLFDSSKFDKAFNYTPTAYTEGIQATVRFYKGQKT